MIQKWCFYSQFFFILQLLLQLVSLPNTLISYRDPKMLVLNVMNQTICYDFPQYTYTLARHDFNLPIWKMLVDHLRAVFISAWVRSFSQHHYTLYYFEHWMQRQLFFKSIMILEKKEFSTHSNCIIFDGFIFISVFSVEHFL